MDSILWDGPVNDMFLFLNCNENFFGIYYYTRYWIQFHRGYLTFFVAILLYGRYSFRDCIRDIGFNFIEDYLTFLRCYIVKDMEDIVLEIVKRILGARSVFREIS